MKTPHVRYSMDSQKTRVPTDLSRYIIHLVTFWSACFIWVTFKYTVYIL